MSVQIIGISTREGAKQKNQKPMRVNHTGLATVFSSVLMAACRAFWYCLRNLLLMNIEMREIVIMLSTTQEI